MKTYFSDSKKLFAVTNEKTVWLVNFDQTKIFKQFPAEHFDVENWLEVENLTSFDKLKKTFDVFQSMTKKQLTEIEILRAKRYENRKKITVRLFLSDLMQKKYGEKLKTLASCLPDMGYSMGAKYFVLLHSCIGSYDNYQEYARSSKFRAVHGCFRLKIDFNTFKNSENIGGLFTYIYPNQKQAVKKCWWYEKTGEKQYYSIKKVNGFICGNYHSTTKDGAKKGWQYICENQKRIEKAQKERAKIEKNNVKNWNKTYSKQLRLQYSYSDSLNAGNCINGTKAFIMRCGLSELKKYRGSFLLKTAQEKSTNSVSFVKRMIEFNTNHLKR